ncbi:MAG TPA: hypothetical protein PK614_02930 [Nitrospira sp.]|nr:hypothetical protein [Nitrospira sp.]
MGIDVSRFHPHNVTDTCAVWHVLSSQILYATALSMGCHFCITQFVLYECLFKPRTHSLIGRELQSRLRREQSKGIFKSYPLAVEDLQDIGILENRQRLSKGELSSIAFAKKTSQAFLTDDQGARKLARGVVTQGVQTTPHLFGWLFFSGHLADGDRTALIREHEAMGGRLSRYFEEMYLESLRCRLMASHSKTADK